MSEWENRIESKIDKIIEKQGEMNVTLARQKITLEVHERRSTNLEKRVVPLEDHIKKSAWMSHVVTKVLAVGAAAAAISEALMHLASFVKGL